MPDDWMTVSTDSGYINEQIFFDWMKDMFIPFVKPTEEDPVLLLMDNLSCHTSVRILQHAADHHVNILTQPPHSSHFLQPLDKSFGQLKAGIASSSLAAQLINGSAQVSLELTFK